MLRATFRRHLQRQRFSTAPSKILFFGTDDFSLPTLKNLFQSVADENSPITSVEVVTASDVRRTPKGQPTPVPVKQFALDNNLTIHEIPAGVSPTSLEQHWQLPPDSEYDLGVVVSFGYFVPPSVLTSLRLGAINVHPSLLPAYRGAAPITWSMLQGDDTTGVSVIEVDPHAFDSGSILLQVEEELHPDEMYSDVRERLSLLGADCLSAAIRNMSLGLRPNLEQHQRGEETPAWKLTQRHGRVRFRQTPYDSNKRKHLECGTLSLNHPPTSRELYNRWRALSETVGVWVDWVQGDGVKTVELRVVQVGFPEHFEPPETEVAHPAGTMVWCCFTKRLLVKCAPSKEEDWTADRHKQWIELKRVQIPGKKVLAAVDFANGQRLKQNPCQLLL